MKSLRTHVFAVIFSASLLFCFGTCDLTAQVAVGTPELSTMGGGPDAINLGNLNIRWTFPIFNKPGRGLPFNYSLTFDNSLFNNNGVVSAAPIGWGALSAIPSGTLRSSHTQVKCGGSGFDVMYTDRWSNFAYIDSSNVHHSFPNAFSTFDNCTSAGTSSGPIAASDGSGYLFSPIAGTGGAFITTPSGLVMNADTSISGSGPVTKITDRNGNWLQRGRTIGSTTTWSDTLGMTALTVTQPSRTGGPPYAPDTYAYTDSNGLPETITVNYNAYTIQTAFVCPGFSDPPARIGPLVSSIVYPDGSNYSFTYEPTPGNAANVTGRLQSVTLPTGGVVSYSYSGPNDGINCSDGSTLNLTRQTMDGTTTYTRTNISGTEWKTVITNPPDSVTGQVNQTDLYFQDVLVAGVASNLFTETKRQIFQGADTGSALETIYTCYNGGVPDCAASQISLPITQRTVLTQLSTGQQSKVVTLLNGTGQVTESDAYDFGSGAPGALLKKTLIQYATLGNNILDRPHIITIQDGLGAQIAQTIYLYDQVAADGTSGVPNHSAPSGGNATTVQRWLNTNGSLLSTTNEFDDTGNLVATTDPNGNRSQFSYADKFADGVNRNSLAYVTQTTLPVTGTTTHVLSERYDANTGLPVSSTDQNNQTTTFSYDKMLSLTQTNFPDGGQSNSTFPSPTEIDHSVKITTSATDQYKTFLDGLGRTSKTQHITPSGTTSIDTTYSSMGLVASITNPYFSTADTTYGTLQQQYDALGRAIKVTEQDGSTRTTDYSLGNCITVSDEAGKQRKACSDALGRLTSVFEDPAGLNYESDYQYDALGNLKRVDQKGSAPADSTQWRTRTFTYDSLSRLLAATSPESGTTTYSYDSNANLLTTIMPAPNQSGSATVTVTNSYDALNRVTLTTYSDGVTPSVNYVYDTSSGWSNPAVTQTNLIGRVSEIYQAGSNSGNQIFSYDPMGRVIANNQCTPSNCTTGSYAVSATYDLAGNLTSLAYPSGRLVNYGYNSASQLNLVQFASWNGTAPSGGAYNYWSTADSNFYPNEAPRSWSMGNGVTESVVLNKRLQLQEDIVGNASIYNFADHLYDYGSQNNGSYATIADQLNASRTQSFTYDSLNRLATANESRWGLSFVDDAWGNNLQQNLTAGSATQHRYTVTNNNQLVGFSYDAAGNVTADGLHTYLFDAENRLTHLDSTAATYTYGAASNRVRKDVSGSASTEYIYFSGHVVAERNVSRGDWTDYIFAGGRRLARAMALDYGLHIYGTRCSACGTQYSLFYLPNAGGLANYTIRTGDKIEIAQYQASGSHGGIVIAFTDGTNTNWNLQDQDGYFANDDQTQTTTHLRRMDLAAFVGKKIQSIAFNQESDTAAGTFAIIYEQTVLTSSDGTMQPLYTGQTASPISSISATSGVTGAGSKIDTNRGKGIYPVTTTTYYDVNQVGSSTLITGGAGWPLWQATYLPYGDEYNPLIGDEHYKFTGMDRGEGNLDHTLFREYTAGEARWLTPDPYMGSMDPSSPQSLNRYAYVNGNPVTFTDPTGLELSQYEGNESGCFMCGTDNSGLYAEKANRSFYGLRFWDLPGTGKFGDLEGQAEYKYNLDTMKAMYGGHGNSDGTWSIWLPGKVGPNPKYGQPNEPPYIMISDLFTFSIPTATRTNANDFSWWGAYAKNLFSVRNFTDEFRQGGCVNVFLNSTKNALNPLSPSLSSGGEAAAAYLTASKYNAAVEYAASQTNYLGGTGLIYPMKSSVVRSMLADANATAASGGLMSLDLALGQGFATEMYSLATGGCR